MIDNKDQKQVSQEMKGVLYEESKMQHALNLLNTIQVNGLNQVKAMSMIFDILSSPIPFTNAKPEQDNE